MQLDEKKEEKTCKTIAKKSKFRRLFTTIYTNIIFKSNGQNLNLYFLPEVIKSLTKYYMPLTPLIIGIMIFEKDEPTMRFAIN